MTIRSLLSIIIYARSLIHHSFSGYSLNVVNRYKENIVHLSAANNCTEILKCILDQHDKCCLERKNSFGWTPLMQAVRNENTEMVKFLLSFGVHVNDFSFLGKFKFDH